MTLRKMLERAAASRAAIEDRTDRLSEARSSVCVGAVPTGSVEDALAGIVTADLLNALSTLAAIEVPAESRIVDGGVLHPLGDIDEAQGPGGAP